MKLLFLCLSYIGQALSYGRFYLAHLALPFMLPELYREIRLLCGSFRRPEHTHILTVFFLFAVLSLCWSSHLEAGLKSVLYLAYGLAQIILVKTLDSAKIKVVLKVLLGITCLEVFISLGEAMTLWRYPISELSSLGLHTDSLDYLSSSPTGLRWSPNNLGLTLIIVSSFMVQYLTSPFSLLGITITSYLNIMTGSRFLFYGYVIVILTQWTLTRRWSWLPALGAAILLPLFLVNVSNTHAHWKAYEMMEFPKRLTNYFSDTTSVISPASVESILVSGEKHTSEIARSNLMKAGWKSFLKSPIFGNGAGSGLYTVSKTEPWSLHNFGLEILVEFGLVGILLALYALWLIFKNSPDKQFTFVMFIILGLGSVAVSSLYYFPAFYLTLGLLGKYQLPPRLDKLA